VSAILKALKKIEQESSGPARDPSISGKLDPKKTLNQRARKSWLLRRLSAAFGLVLVLAAGIVLGFAYGPSFLKSSLSSPNLSDLPKDRERGEMLSPQERQGQSVDRPTKSREKSDSLNAPAPDVASAPLHPRKERPLIAQGPRKTRTPQNDMEPPLPRGEDQPQAEAHPVLELQAIVWSHDPESCFAVINGHIVRANGMVEGVSVTEISQDAVTLKQGEKVWKMRMLEGD
jgi:hypothetical protein